MPENNDKDGGTPDPKTFTQEEVDVLVTAGKKDGASDSWRHFQSEADKQIAAIKNSGSTKEVALTKELDDLKAARIANLPAEEQMGAMVRELYNKDREGVKSTSSQAPGNTSVDNPAVPSGDYDKQMQDAIGSILKDQGLDPSKVKWGDGPDANENLKVFLGSVVEQAKAQQGDGKASDDNKSDDAKQEDKTSSNNVDTSRSSGSNTDRMTMAPADIVRQEKWTPIVGMMEA